MSFFLHRRVPLATIMTHLHVLWGWVPWLSCSRTRSAEQAHVLRVLCSWDRPSGQGEEVRRRLTFNLVSFVLCQCRDMELGAGVRWNTVWLSKARGPPSQCYCISSCWLFCKRSLTVNLGLRLNKHYINTLGDRMLMEWKCLWEYQRPFLKHLHFGIHQMYFSSTFPSFRIQIHMVHMGFFIDLQLIYQNWRGAATKYKVYGASKKGRKSIVKFSIWTVHLIQSEF